MSLSEELTRFLTNEENDPLQEKLYQAINRLNNAEKVVIQMYLDKVSQREMSEILGITEVAVGERVYRIKKKLMEINEKLNRE